MQGCRLLVDNAILVIHNAARNRIGMHACMILHDGDYERLPGKNMGHLYMVYILFSFGKLQSELHSILSKCWETTQLSKTDELPAFRLVGPTLVHGRHNFRTKSGPNQSAKGFPIFISPIINRLKLIWGVRCITGSHF